VRLLSAALGASLLISSVPAFAGGALQIVDLTGQFDRFAMTTKALPDAQRLTAFEAEVGPIADGFYARDRRPNHYDLRVLSNLRTYPERRSAVLAVSRQFPGLFNHARRSFEAKFGPVTSDQPVFLVDSLGELDGGTRELNGKPTLLFGADVIAEVHSGQDMTAFFHHELFHLYHEPKVSKCAAIWCALWEEGLATYVASRLDPKAGDDALSLSVPAPIRPQVESDRPLAICAVVRRLESTTDKDFADLFMADARLPGFPSRMGYYIGYLVASDIGRSHGLHEMAEMSLVEARPLIDASLARMATCSATTAEARERSRPSRTRS
jgi:hypothetical protein